MANVQMQLLLELRQFRQAWNQAAAAAQQGGQKISRSAQQGGRALGDASKKATGFAGAIDFLKKRVIGAGLFFAAFYQGLITFRQLIGNAVTELFDLDDALRRVQSITKESDASIARLKDNLLGLAKQGKLFDQSAADVADSMFEIAQAGFSSAEALTLARIGAEGAAVGFTQADTAATLLVNVLKAYDLPVSEARNVMDVLFQTVDTGIITFETLAGGLGKVLSSASALGVPLEEIGGAVATMTLRGFTGAQAMTSLGRMMQTFIRPSQRAKDTASELGIELNAATIKSKGFIVTLQEMFAATGGNVEKFAQMFDRIQSTRGAISLFSDGGKLFTAVMEDMGLATAGAGAMATAMEERAKSLKFQLSVLRSQVLAVIVDALEPLMAGMAGVLGSMNNVLAGRNRLFNYFADLQALVTAVVVAFLFMQRAAIHGIFTNIARAMSGFVTIARVSRAEVGLLGTAVRSLSALLGALAPMLIFMAVFAVAKFATQMGNADRAMRKMADATAKFEERLAGIRELDLPANILFLREIELAKNGLEDLIDDLVGDFQKAGDAVDDLFGIPIGKRAGETLDQIARGIFTLGQSTDSELDKIRGKFKETVDQWIEGAKLSRKELTELSEIFRILERDAETSEQAELYRLAAEQLGVGADNANEMEQVLRDAQNAAQDFREATGQAIFPISDVREAIEKWLKPIKEAKGLMEDILGLTSNEDILLRAQIAPIEEQIARRNEEIADNLVAQHARATELGIPLSAIKDSEDGILTTLQDQSQELEDHNTKDRAIIDSLAARLETEEKIDASLLAQLDLLDFQAGKMPLLNSLTNDSQRVLAEMVRIMLHEGVPALEEWIVKEQEAGRVLEDDVLDALLDIVSKLEGGEELEIDVTDALTKLGLVRGVAADVFGMERTAALAAQAFLDDPFSREAAAALAAGRQHGIRNFVGGLMRVGEAGEELVRLPRGSDVIPQGGISPALRQQAAQTPSLSAHAEVNITTSLLKDFVELKKAVLRAVEEQLDTAAARANLARPRFGTLGVGMART